MQVRGSSLADSQCCRVQNQLNSFARYNGMKKMLASSGSLMREGLTNRYSCSLISTAQASWCKTVVRCYFQTAAPLNTHMAKL